MDYMTELTAIAKTHGGIIETKIAAQRGISKAMLYKLCKEDKIHRIVKGQYILPDDMQDELLAISNRSERIIFSHETALYLHGISDRSKKPRLQKHNEKSHRLAGRSTKATNIVTHLRLIH